MIKKAKIFLQALLEMALQLRRKIKLYYFKAFWKCENTHNKTVAGNIFPINRVKVGTGSYGVLNIHWFGTNEGFIQIGHYCSIAENVHFFLAGEHDYKRFSSYPFSAHYGKTEPDEICKGPIHVGDDVWIGFGVTILSGVKIGKGAVIAAGSIVTKDVPPYAIWINNHVFSYRFDEEVISKLENIPLEKLNPIKLREDDIIYQHINNINIDETVQKIRSFCNNKE